MGLWATSGALGLGPLSDVEGVYVCERKWIFLGANAAKDSSSSGRRPQ